MRKTPRLLCACLMIALLLCAAPGARADYYSDWVALRQATLKSTEDLLRLYITPELRTDQYVKIAYNTYNTIKYGTINAVNIVEMLFELNSILRDQAIRVLSYYTSTLKTLVDAQKIVYEKARADEDAGLPAADRKAEYEGFTTKARGFLDDAIGFMDEFSADHPVFLTLNPTYKNHLQDSRREAVSLKSAVPSYYYIYLAERAEYARKKLTLPFSYNLTNQRAPGGTLLLGKPFGLRGDVTASHIISALTAQVRRTSDGGIVQTKTIYPNALSASVLGTLNNSIIFDTMPAGDYTYHVVMEISSLGKSIEIIRSSFTIAPAEEPVMVIGNAISAESITLGQSVTTEISTSGGIGAISYRFEVYREGVVVDDSGYVDYSTLVYQPRETGSYQILAYAKDGQNTDFLPGLPFLVKAPSVPVAVVQLDREEVLLGLGDGATLIATVYPENASDKTLHWVSDQPAVADVDMYGEIWGHAVGSALVTARAKDGSGVSAQCVVTVTEETPRPVEIVQSTISDDRLRLGAYQVCSIISSGGIGEVSYRFVAFRDDVIVFDTGYFPLNGVRYQPQETGNYTLHTFARDELGTTYYEGLPFVVIAAEVVPPVKVSQIVLGEDQLALKIGDSRALTAQTAPADAADKRLSWVSDTPQVAAVDQSGAVTALAAGSARITVTAMDGGQASAVCAVLVSDPAAAQGKRGDATDDGRVDMEDLSAILDYLVNGTLCDSMGNANADAINGIDLRDLLWVIDQLIGS